MATSPQRPSATNIATQHLLDKVPPSVVITQIAPNVFACAESDVQSVRQALSTNKQVLRYLDRNIRASNVYLNDEGETCWVLHRSGVIGDPFLGTGFARVVQKSATKADAAGPDAGYFRGTLRNVATRTGCGFVKGELKVPVTVWHDHTWQGAAGAHTVNPNVAGRTQPEGPLFLSMGFKQFGSYAIGGRSDISLAIAGTQVEGATFDGNPTASAPYQYAIGWYSSIVPDEAQNVVIPVKAVAAPKPVLPALKTNLVVIAGPACMEHGEFYPNGFAVIAVSMGELSDAIRSVVLTADPTGAQSADVIKRLNDMSSSGKAYIVAYKGTADVLPASLLPTKYGLKGEFDPTTIGGQSMSDITAQWNSGLWGFTVTSQTSTGSFATLVLKGTGPVTVKASSATTVHFDDGEGILDIEIANALFVIAAARRAGRTVTFVASPFTTKSDFDKAGYEALVATAATDGAEAVKGEGLEANVEGVGESIAVSVMMKPTYKKDEGGLLAAFMTPEYFWAGVNK